MGKVRLGVVKRPRVSLLTGSPHPLKQYKSICLRKGIYFHVEKHPPATKRGLWHQPGV